jgi:hypothetical protein
MQACEELFAVTGELDPSLLALGYGSDPQADAAYDLCQAGASQACKDLVVAAPAGSDYLDFDFGDPASAPSPQPTAGTTEVAQQPAEVDDYGDDPALDALWDRCAAADWNACDQLYLVSPIGSAYEWYGYTCGGTTSGGVACEQASSGEGIDWSVIGVDPTVGELVDGDGSSGEPLGGEGATTTAASTTTSTTTTTSSTTTTTTAPAPGSVILASGTFDLPPGGNVDLHFGHDNVYNADFEWDFWCSEEFGDDLSCYEWKRELAQVMVHPSGANTYEDCATQIPEGLLVIGLDSIPAAQIPEAETGGRVPLCYRTEVGKLGIMYLSRYSTVVCPTAECEVQWRLLVGYTTWDN